MEQKVLNGLWRLNRRAVRLGIPILGIACSSNGCEDVIEVGLRTWQRRMGTLKWLPMKPFAGNLRT